MSVCGVLKVDADKSRSVERNKMKVEVKMEVDDDEDDIPLVSLAHWSVYGY